MASALSRRKQGFEPPRERHPASKTLSHKNSCFSKCLLPGACYTRVLQGQATMGRMKYVQRRANRYEFRFPLPDDLAGKPVPEPCPETLAPFVNARTGRFKTELIRSLQTTDGRAADRKALAH